VVTDYNKELFICHLFHLKCEIIVSFKGRVIFRLCDSTGYMYDVKIIPGEGQTVHSTALDSNPFNSDRPDE
jgi:hypothetical protein